MILKKMELYNFRQFIGTQVVEFSTEKERNVTVLIGDNTSGKTTFVRAFEWILYGRPEPDFEDKVLLNKNVVDNMSAGEIQEVRGVLWLNHGGTDFEIKRTQQYTCIGDGVVRGTRTEPKISYMHQDGQTKTTIRSDFETNIESILPRNLSNYFFFGGERIGAISTREDIEASVKGLMGLDILYNAMNHLKSVNGKFKKGMEFSGDAGAKEIQKQLEEQSEQLNACWGEAKNIEEQLSYYRKEKEKYAALLKANENVAEELELREKLEKSVKGLEERIKKSQNEYVSVFSRDAFAYFGIPLLKEVAELLEDAHEEVESVPEMNAAAIDYLLERGFCICGTPIEKGSEAEKNLLKERAKQPPEAIGSLVRRFKEQALEYLTDSERYVEDVTTKFNDIKSAREELGFKRDEIDDLDKRLKNKKDISLLEEEYKKAEKRILEFEQQQTELREQIGAMKNEIVNTEAKLESYSLNSSKNAKLSLYMDYAHAVKEWVEKAYYEKEKVIREKLEEKVNNNFQKMYHGSRKVMIDEKYRVKYYDVTTEESDGLKAVKSFAFVAGIVELAQETLTLNNTADIGPLYYPLVMDAPFSNMDRRHIENISRILPEAAEQVIIAVMEKDWEPAVSIMQKYIGKAYKIDKFDETIAHIKSQEG